MAGGSSEDCVGWRGRKGVKWEEEETIAALRRNDAITRAAG